MKAWKRKNLSALERVSRTLSVLLYSIWSRRSLAYFCFMSLIILLCWAVNRAFCRRTNSCNLNSSSSSFLSFPAISLWCSTWTFLPCNTSYNKSYLFLCTLFCSKVNYVGGSWKSEDKLGNFLLRSRKRGTNFKKLPTSRDR